MENTEQRPGMTTEIPPGGPKKDTPQVSDMVNRILEHPELISMIAARNRKARRTDRRHTATGRPSDFRRRAGRRTDCRSDAPARQGGIRGGCGAGKERCRRTAGRHGNIGAAFVRSYGRKTAG